MNSKPTLPDRALKRGDLETDSLQPDNKPSEIIGETETSPAVQKGSLKPHPSFLETVYYWVIARS